jgi:hypothetical protein
MASPIRPEVLERVAAALDETGQPPRIIRATLPDLTRSWFAPRFLCLSGLDALLAMARSATTATAGLPCRQELRHD